MRLAALALLASAAALGGCGKEAAQNAPAAPVEPPVPTPPIEEAPATPDAALVEAVKPPGPIPASSRQLVVSIAETWTSQTVHITRFEREAGGSWQQVGESFDAAIGAGGLGWGVGIHPDVTQANEPTKQEGDKRSPAGLFRIGSSYGYGDSLPMKSGIGYMQSKKTLRCVDDASSAYYNKIIDEASVSADWSSAEYMKPRHPLYELLVTIDHNNLVPSKATGVQPAPVSGAGSCVFFHLWRRLSKPTLGCTAMSKENLVELIAWLDESREPVALFLPLNRYSGLQSDWELPDS